VGGWGEGAPVVGLESEKLPPEGAAVVAGIVVRAPEEVEEGATENPKPLVVVEVAGVLPIFVSVPVVVIVVTPPNDKDFFAGSLPAPPPVTAAGVVEVEDKVNPPVTVPALLAPPVLPKLPNPVEEFVVGVDEDFPNPKLVPLEPFAFGLAFVVPNEKLLAGADDEEAAGVEGVGVPKVKVITVLEIFTEIEFVPNPPNKTSNVFVGHTRLREGKKAIEKWTA
jgi:hypothetical protein